MLDEVLESLAAVHRQRSFAELGDSVAREKWGNGDRAKSDAEYIVSAIVAKAFSRLNSTEKTNEGQ